jgi:putative intracellular protease/amidase
MLRTDEAIKAFIRDALRRRLLIASICHGPQLLISTKSLPLGTKATSVGDVRIDLANAGFRLPEGPDSPDAYDKAHPVVYDEDQRLITSPSPKALKEIL